MKAAFASDLDPVRPMQSNLTDFTDDPRNADLQLLNRPRISENISRHKRKNSSRNFNNFSLKIIL